MKWFGKWMLKVLKKANDDENDRISTTYPMNKVSVSADSDWGDGLNIRVHSAMGGKIVSFTRYDRKADRSNNSVYVIPDDHDFERELGKLITLESMKG